MAHVRAQIRDAVALVVTGLGATVKKTRKFPTNAAELPRFHVYTMSERLDDNSSNLYAQGRILTLAIEAVATGGEDALDDTLDAFAVSIESALESSKNYSPLVVNRDGEVVVNRDGQFVVLDATPDSDDYTAVDTKYISVEIDIDSTGKESIGAARLTFEVLYRTIRGAPQTAV